jgi:hypothetical protein
MRATFRSLSLVAVLFLAAACRQQDGPIPQPSGDEPDEVYELSRDILNVAGGDKQAFQELSDDLGSQGPLETGRPGAGALAKSLQTALAGRRVSEDQAKRLAGDLYIVFAADKLSSNQVEALQGRVSGLLREVGVPDGAIEPVQNDITSVQALVNKGGRRWWQIL